MEVNQETRNQICKGDHGIRTLSFSLVVAGMAAFISGQAAPVGGALEFFENRIRPVLVEHCYECHSATARKVEGGLRVDSREGLLKGGDSGPALVPGDPAKSLLLRALRHEHPDLAMPAKQP